MSVLPRTACFSVVVVGVVVLLCAASAAAAACSSAVLQLQAFKRDANPYALANECFPGDQITINSLKAICMSGLKASVDSSGIIRLAPLSTETYGYTYPPSGGINQGLKKPCKDLNASGLFNLGSTTKATVTLFDDVGGPLSTLVKNADNTITLTPAHTYSNFGSNEAPPCAYKFTVSSGCFMGISGPPSPPSPPCHKNWRLATGLGGAKYCAPCPPGTSSSGTTCAPCPVGTYNPNWGASCQACAPGYYAAKPGADTCAQCSQKWTDGKTCNACPKGSVVSTLDPRQCLRCDKGVKCCTVNDSPTCPKCGTGTMTTNEYTSTFVLSSISSTTCQTTYAALCTPQFKLTLLPDCSIIYQNIPPALPDRTYCDQYGQVGILGPKASVKDIPRVIGDSFPGANFSKAVGSDLFFTVPNTKGCTLTYRALDGPAAALLGVPPKAGTSTSCPAGQYLDKKPGSCLPCPPGTYNPKPSSKTSCDPCSEGHAVRGYGNKACPLCPFNLPLASPGSSLCQPCPPGGIRTGVNKCTYCPAGTSKADGSDKCLGSDKGSICCALGNCKGIPACPKTMSQNQDSNLAAIFQMQTKSLAGAECKKAYLLTCLADKAYIGVASTSNFDNAFVVTPLQQPKCVWGLNTNTGTMDYITLIGSATSAKRGAGTLYLQGPQPNSGLVSGYEVSTSSKDKTLTIYLSKNLYPQGEYPPELNVTSCSATFKLVAGYAFDLTPPPGAKCPASTIQTTFAGRAFCKFCSPGLYKKGSSCTTCGVGTYNDVYGAAACKTCPAGTACDKGTGVLFKCPPGTRAEAPGSQYCVPCGKDTYANLNPGATKCLPCPAQTFAPKGSAACSVPFMTSL